MGAHSTSWTNEKDYQYRGCKENSYVITNSLITEVATGYYVAVPELAHNISGNITAGTTVLYAYNNDWMMVPNNQFGTSVLNRSMIIDEVGLEIAPNYGCNSAHIQLTGSIMWADQSAISNYSIGTCSNYWAAILPTTGGTDLGNLVLHFNDVDNWTSFTSSMYIAGLVLTDTVTGAVMYVTAIADVDYTNYNIRFYGIMADANDFAAPNPVTFGSSGYDVQVVSFARRSGVISGDDSLRWGPDRYYNSEYDANHFPLGRGPNVIVGYADADGETVAVEPNKILMPQITASLDKRGIWKPPKNSVILDPYQAIMINLDNLHVPPPFYSEIPITAEGTIDISAWIRFRMPLDTEIQYVRHNDRVIF